MTPPRSTDIMLRKGQGRVATRIVSLDMIKGEIVLAICVGLTAP
jgi:hypothetical protein